MRFRGIEAFPDYQKLLKEDDAEVGALCQDILIQVTMFFREPDSFDLLKTSIFPGLFKGRASQDPIRVWVAGCSSGEEAYSILISLTEYMRETNRHFPIQLFGTDINESAIQKARAGIYAENSMAELSEERINSFFTKDEKRYTIHKSLRDLCVFAKHNVLCDPPFAKIDLLSCQNVLIYFDASLQKRVLSIFHYALKATGVLLLGRAETPGSNPDLFAPLKHGTRAHLKVPSHSHMYFDFVGGQQTGDRIMELAGSSPKGVESSTNLQVQKEVDRLVLQQFTPSGVVFNERLEVIQFRGNTGPYFSHSPGFATFDLLKMLHGGLIADVRLAIEEVREKGEGVRKENIKVRTNGELKRLAIELFPVRVGPARSRFFLLTFEDMDLPSVDVINKRRADKKEASEHPTGGEEMAAIRAELSSTKDYLQSINEQNEAANEELRAANEEIMSSNEELQSTNEELHTAKEELQSTNEELLTVNDELQNRNREFSQVNNDLRNLFTSLSVAVVILNRELRIRRFTPVAEQLLGLVPANIGCRIMDIDFKVNLIDLNKNVAEVLRTLTPMQLEAQDSEGKWYSIEIRPYRTTEEVIDGAILVFTDINRIKISSQYAEAIEETIGRPLLILDSGLKIKKANEKFHQFFKTSPSETDGCFIYELENGGWNIPKLKVLLEEVLPKNTTLNNFNVTHVFPKIGRKQMCLDARRLFSNSKSTETILLVFDVT